MSRRTRRVALLGVLLVTLGVVPTASAEPGPSGVSPGAAEAFAPTTGACPTFSWGPATPAAALDLVVYSVDEEGVRRVEPALRAALPPGAASWTPAADTCLEAGRYAWSVRSTATGEWSNPLLFEVGGMVDQERFREAVETVRSYLAAHPEAAAESVAIDAVGAAQVHLTPLTSTPPAALTIEPAAPGDAAISIDGEYAYSAPRAYSTFVGANEFESAGASFVNRGTIAQSTSDVGWTAQATIALPNGAIAKNLECYYVINATGGIESFDFALHTRPLVSSVVAVTGTSTNDPSDTANPSLVIGIVGPTLDVTIDNPTNQYQVVVFFDPTNGVGAAQQSFYGCRIAWQASRASAD